ncbi:ATP-binding protein [Paenibacillus sp. M1]|uniref:histidine kinase n=1 Tax=Paenibacillus haidiansis TaxID=1574488 RepID=A0ABU7VUF6_9BACL
MLKTYKKPLITIVIFVVVITAIRLLWTNVLTYLDYPDPPSVKNGVLDLRGFRFNEHQTLRLNGEWEFYPSALLTPSNLSTTTDAFPVEPVKINVPGNWDSFFSDPESFHYGTYRLKISLDPDIKETFAIRISRIGNASAVYANGQLLAAPGRPSAEADKHQIYNIPYTVTIPPGSDRLDLLIQVSHNNGKSGIYKPIRFGTIDAIKEHNLLLIGLQLLLCVVFLLHCLYSLALYLLGSNNKGLSYFSILVVLGAISVLVADDRLLFQWIDIDYEWMTKISYMTYAGIAAVLPPLIHHLFPSYGNPKLLKGFEYYCSFYFIFIVISPASYILATSAVLLLFALLISVSLCVHILYRASREKEDIIYLLLASIGVGINVIWASIMVNSPNREFINYPFDLIFALIAFAAFWFRRFFHATNKTKQLAERLQFEDKRKDEFLVNTSHELRNPLQGISTMLQVILDDGAHPLHPKQKERVDIIRGVSYRLNSMLDDLIEVTRLKERTVSLKKEPVYIQSIVSGVVDIIKAMLQGKPVALHVEMDEFFPAVYADENRVVQILFNLLHNAAKCTDTGYITIRVQKLHRMAEIQIEDTGIGIAAEDLPNIFHPYEQVIEQSDRAGGGFGLGLSICKQLVELQNGTITVESALGKGSIFKFTLPLYDGNFAEEEPESSPVHTESVNMTAAAIAPEMAADDMERPVLATSKLLVVDDDAVNVNILTEALKTDGYAITGVTSAEQAMAAIEADRYDLVIADVMMPKISGYELTRLIRERFDISELPILLLTARSRTEDIVAGFRAGANDYVKKPVDALELKGRIRTLIKLKSTVDDRLRIESAWLQSQIQPHFLFNTLNSIAALGSIDIEKMQKLLDEFSNYLRLSFDFGNVSPLVPISRELSLTRSYVYIEQERFGERLNVIWDIDREADALIPPLTIQPLVENAVKHGLMSRSRGGTVTVSIHKQPDHVWITVKDDGTGMHNSDKESGGIGLKNINRRLKQLFGTELAINSAPDAGTIISFKIPYKKAVSE